MNWKRVCAAADVPENKLKKFDVGGIAIIIANYGDGFRGFPPLCPHMEEPLDKSGIMMVGILTCSKHLWQWDLRSGDLMGETEKALLFYDVKQEGDDIFADIENELSYDYVEDGEKDDDNLFASD